MLKLCYDLGGSKQSNLLWLIFDPCPFFIVPYGPVMPQKSVTLETYFCICMHLKYNKYIIIILTTLHQFWSWDHNKRLQRGIHSFFTWSIHEAFFLSSIFCSWYVKVFSFSGHIGTTKDVHSVRVWFLKMANMNVHMIKKEKVREFKRKYFHFIQVWNKIAIAVTWWMKYV